jgi:hypothetical protein
MHPRCEDLSPGDILKFVRARRRPLAGERLIAVPARAFVLLTAMLLPRCISSPARPAAVATASGDRILRGLLLHHCTYCHDQHAEAPDLDGLERAPELAVEVAMVVGAGNMPRFPGVITREDRESLIQRLCGLGARDSERCVSSALGSTTGRVVLTSNAITRAADALLGPRPSSAQGPSEKMFSRIPKARARRLDLTYALYASMFAVERCGARTATVGGTPCVAALISEDVLTFPDASSSVAERAARAPEAP